MRKARPRPDEAPVMRIVFDMVDDDVRWVCESSVVVYLAI